MGLDDFPSGMAYSVINDLLVLGSVPYKSTKVYVPPRKMNMFPPFLKGSESFAPNFTNFQNGGSPPDALPPQVDEAAQGASRSAALEDGER